MTLLPVDSWNVKPRADLPAYDLNRMCANPNAFAPATENHHLWRRSFHPGAGDVWWVELEGGIVVPNRVGLSAESHRLVTENRVRISYHDLSGLFLWCEVGARPETYRPLRPQPGPRGALQSAPRSATDEFGDAAQLTVEGEEVPHAHVVAANGNEKPCPKCKGRGRVVGEPKDESLPQAPARAKTTWSVRVPRDERENGYEVLEGLMEACVERMGELKLIRDRNRGANYYTLVAALRKFALGEDA